MNIILPDRGTIRVLGEQSYSAANDRVAYLPEERGLYKQMKVRDVLRFYAVQNRPRQPVPPVTHVGIITNWFEELRAKVPTGR